MVFKISVDVKNVGGRKGDEVVQLYLHDFVASVTRPVKELKGFRIITLELGEKKTASFTPESKGSILHWLERIMELGTFVVLVSKLSEDIQLTSSFEVKTAAEIPRLKTQKRKGKKATLRVIIRFQSIVDIFRSRHRL